MSDISEIPNCKIILLGNTCVGKTSIVLQFYKSYFNDEVQPTIGASYIAKTVETTKGKINLNVWDTAGQERFKSIIPMYLRGSHAIICVCSVDDPKSISDLNTWKELIKLHLDEEKVEFYVVLNKIDLCEENSTEKPTEAKKFADENGYKYFETSAKDKKSINELFQSIAEDVVVKFKFESNNINIAQSNDTKEKKSSCC